MLYYILFGTNLTATDAVIHFLITVFIYFFAISIHEFAHAFSAFKCGDPTAKLAGRMTINPLKHINISGLLFFMFLGVGWANPVPVNPMNYKKFKKGTRLVSISGILANFIVGLLSAIIYAILLATVGVSVGTSMGYVYSILEYSMLINSFIAMFNLLPIPPLDGFNFFASFCKTENKFLKFMMKNGIRVLLSFVIVGVLTDLFFGFDIFTIYLSLINDFIYYPIVWLGVL